MFPTYFSSQTGAVLQVVQRVWPWACCRTTSTARHHGWDLLFKRHGFWHFGINNVNMFFCFPFLFCLDLLKIGNIGKPIKSRAGFQPRFLQVDAGRGRLRLPVPWLGEWLGHFWRCWLDPKFFMVNFLITFFFAETHCVASSPMSTQVFAPLHARRHPERLPFGAPVQPRTQEHHRLRVRLPKAFWAFEEGKNTEGTFVIAGSWFWIDLSIEIYMYSIYVYIIYIYSMYIIYMHYIILLYYTYTGGWCFHWYALQCILVFD